MGATVRRAGSVIAAVVLALVLAAGAVLAATAGYEAEAMSLSGGATTAGSPADSVRFDANGEQATQADGGIPNGNTVVMVGKRNSVTTGDRVCAELLVDGVVTGTRQCYGLTANTFAERSWTGLTLNDGSDIAVRSIEISAANNEVLFVDKVRVDGPDPVDPYPNPDSRNATPAPGWTPNPGTLHIGPSIDCGTDPTPSTGGDSVNLAGNVTLVNPNVENCNEGVSVEGPATIIWDDTQDGYNAAMFNNNRRAIVFAQGARDAQIKRANPTSRGSFVDNYRPVTFEAGRNLLVEGVHTSHPASLPWQTDEPRSFVGIKALADYPDLDPADKAVHDVEIRHNRIEQVQEEGISMDANGNVGSEAVSLVRDTGTVGSVSLANNTVTVSGLTVTTSTLDNALLWFNNGGDVGRYLRITGVSGNTFTVSALHGENVDTYLDGVAQGNSVSLGAAYYDVDIHHNYVDIDGGYDNADFHGPVYSSEIRDNTFVGTPRRRYQNQFHHRTVDGVSQYQCIRNQTLTDIPGGPGDGAEVGMASYNSLTGNDCTWDITNATRGGTVSGVIPYYAALNEILPAGSGGAVEYNDGTYQELAADPNP